MINSPGLLGVPGGGIPLRVLGPDFPGRLSFSRASGAMARNAAGVWQPAASDAPRFHNTARRLLVESPRTNALRNPRAEGAVPGAPGTLPTGWATTGSWTREIAGTGVEDGLPYCDIRLSGATAVSTGGVLPHNYAIAAQLNDIWTASCFVRVVGGSKTAFTALRCELIARDGAGTSLASANASLLETVGSGTLVTQRFSVSRQMTEAAVSRVESRILFTTSGAFDLTLRIGAPQLELGEVPTSPILPAAGALVASSRAAELPVWAPPGGFGPSGTLVLSALLPSLAVFGVHQGLAQIDDGTDANRLLIRNTSGGSAVFGVVDSGGANLAALSGGSMAPGVPFRAALAWAPGGLAFCLNGGAVQTAAVTLPATLTRLLLGHASTGLNRAANGEVGLVDFRPVRLPDAMLQAVTAAA